MDKTDEQLRALFNRVGDILDADGSPAVDCVEANEELLTAVVPLGWFDDVVRCHHQVREAMADQSNTSALTPTIGPND